MASQNPRTQFGAVPGALVAVVLALLASSCSLASLTSEPLSEPVPIAALTEQAATTTPAEWASEPLDGWPALVPAPTFIDGSVARIENARTGERTASLQTSSAVDEDAVVAYIALLLDVGFVPDLRSATHGWFVRDDVEWVALQNRDLADFMVEGSSANPRSFVVVWTNNPVGGGYCRIVEVGGETCRE